MALTSVPSRITHAPGSCQETDRTRRRPPGRGAAGRAYVGASDFADNGTDLARRSRTKQSKITALALGLPLRDQNSHPDSMTPLAPESALAPAVAACRDPDAPKSSHRPRERPAQR